MEWSAAGDQVCCFGGLLGCAAASCTQPGTFQNVLQSNLQMVATSPGPLTPKVSERGYAGT